MQNQNNSQTKVEEEKKDSQDLIHQISPQFLKTNIEDCLIPKEEINIYPYQFRDFRSSKILRK